MKYIFLVVSALFIFACGNNSDKKTMAKIPLFDETINKDTVYGVMGIYKLPEMLVISYLDSAKAEMVSAKVAESYSVLGAEMNEIAAETIGVPGQIMYNNDPMNFKFESFVPLKKLPVLQPKRCKIVTLPPNDMLMYNYFGEYQELFHAYDEIRKYMKDSGLEQNGAAREYYVTDPTTEQNPKKWHTRIMVPVVYAVKENPAK